MAGKLATFMAQPGDAPPSSSPIGETFFDTEGNSQPPSHGADAPSPSFPPTAISSEHQERESPVVALAQDSVRIPSHVHDYAAAAAAYQAGGSLDVPSGQKPTTAPPPAFDLTKPPISAASSSTISPTQQTQVPSTVPRERSPLHSSTTSFTTSKTQPGPAYPAPSSTTMNRDPSEAATFWHTLYNRAVENHDREREVWAMERRQLLEDLNKAREAFALLQENAQRNDSAISGMSSEHPGSGKVSMQHVIFNQELVQTANQKLREMSLVSPNTVKKDVTPGVATREASLTGGPSTSDDLPHPLVRRGSATSQGRAASSRLASISEDTVADRGKSRSQSSSEPPGGDMKMSPLSSELKSENPPSPPTSAAGPGSPLKTLASKMTSQQRLSRTSAESPSQPSSRQPPAKRLDPLPESPKSEAAWKSHLANATGKPRPSFEGAIFGSTHTGSGPGAGDNGSAIFQAGSSGRAAAATDQTSGQRAKGFLFGSDIVDDHHQSIPHGELDEDPELKSPKILPENPDQGVSVLDLLNTRLEDLATSREGSPTGSRPEASRSNVVGSRRSHPSKRASMRPDDIRHSLGDVTSSPEIHTATVARRPGKQPDLASKEDEGESMGAETEPVRLKHKPSLNFGAPLGQMPK